MAGREPPQRAREEVLRGDDDADDEAVQRECEVVELDGRGEAGVALVCLIVAGGDGTASGGGGGGGGGGHVDAAMGWCALDVVYAAGYVKVVVTLVKYTPQLLANWRNGSTRGWSIWQILLDYAGGVLSIAQQGVDSYLQRDWSGITGNPVKFALGNASLVYDVLFMVQHYVLYPGKDKDGGEEEEEEDEVQRGEGERRRLIGDEER